MRKKTTAERGMFKNEIHAALYKNVNLKTLLLGDTSNKGKLEILQDFKKHVYSHLFIDDTVTESGSYIYYDVIMPRLGSNIKDCKIILYAICHRDILDVGCNFDGYYGNRADVMSQMIEEALMDEKVINDFGIGMLTLDSIGIYNSARFYGCIMEYVIPNFR